MDEITRLKRGSTGIELDFVDAVHTPVELMEHAVQLYLAGLSLKKTVIALEQFGVFRAKSTIHNWVQKADLEPRAGCAPDRVALDEHVVKVNGEKYWFVAAVEPSTNRNLHAGLYFHRNMGMTTFFLEELDEKQAVHDAEFLGDGAPWLHPGLVTWAFTSARKPSAIAMRSNVSFKRSNDGPNSSITISATPVLRLSKTGCSPWLGQKIG